MTKGELIVVEAESWVSTPFHWGAKVKKVGVDCAQLVVASLEAAGATFDDNMIYSRGCDLMARVETVLSEICTDVPLTDPWMPGDILVVRTPKIYQHGAIYVGGNKVIHVATSIGGNANRKVTGKTVKVSVSERWRDRVHKVYRYE